MNLDQLLSEAAHGVADRVDPPEVDLHAVRSRATRGQRRKAAAVLAAAVAAAVLVGTPVLVGRDTTAPPRPAAPPTTGIVRTLPDSDCAEGRCLDPGQYSIQVGRNGDGYPLYTTLTLEDAGWGSNGFLHSVSQRGGDGAVALNVYRPYSFAGPRPCDADGASATVAPDATVDDVARLLATLPQLEVVEGPRALPAVGRDTRYLRVRADRLICPVIEGAQYNLADIYGGVGVEQGGDSDIDPGRPVLVEFWVVDLEGAPVVVEARQEGFPDASMVERLDRARESVTLSVGR